MIACDRLVRIYSTAGIEVQALQGLNLLVGAGELTALVGASGSGKSTLLNILAGLDTPTAGQAWVAGHDLLAMGTRDRLAYRRSVVGFLWQQTSRNLFSHLTAAENVALPMRLAWRHRAERRSQARDLLEMTGVGYCADRMPAQMSGGEQQRVAVGIALANEPSVLLADEPTGELDSESADEVFSALRTANAELGVTILVVTHDPRCRPRRAARSRSGTARSAARCCAGPPSTPAAGRPTWRRSTPCSTGPAGCRFRATSSRPSACGTGCCWPSGPITSASGRIPRTRPARAAGRARPEAP